MAAKWNSTHTHAHSHAKVICECSRTREWEEGRKKERFWSFLFDLQLYNTLCEMTVTTNRVCNFQQCKPQKPFGITNGSSSSNRSNRSTKVAFSIHFQLMKVHSIRLPMTHTHTLTHTENAPIFVIELNKRNVCACCKLYGMLHVP